MHRDGYGFLIADRPVEGVAGDIYIPADASGNAMHGDRVVVRIARIEPGGRADGEIVKILKRAHPTVVGEFHVRSKGLFVIPHDERLNDWIEIPPDLAIPAPSEQVDRIGPKPLTVTDPEINAAYEKNKAK
jgi:ribonuclease R